jgi:glycosyltransferase involved in cell wall biosynthesis
MEKKLVYRANILIAGSEAIQSKFAQTGRTSHLLKHGVDLDHWKPINKGSAIPQLDGLQRPLIACWGIRDQHLDVAFLRRLAADLQNGTIVVAASETDSDLGLDGIDRVVCLPPLSYEQLPRLAREAEVLIMPHTALPDTCTSLPMRLKEYMASGKPVVAREMPMNRSWADCLDRVGTPESFSQTVRLRLRTKLPEDQERSRTRLVDESWTDKARAFEHWVGAWA